MKKIIMFIIEAAILILLFSLYEYLKKQDNTVIKVLVKLVQITFIILVIGLYILMIWALVDYIKEGNTKAVISLLIPIALLTIFTVLNIYLRRKEEK